MTALVLALGASLTWGLADFIAGLKSRAVPVLVVTVISTATGTGVILIAVAISGEGPPARATSSTPP